jgi:hypothetical protein
MSRHVCPRCRSRLWSTLGRVARNCSICVHPERSHIDLDLISGRPYRDISGRHGVSKSAVERHASEHLASAIARGAQSRDRIDAGLLIAELRVLREVTLGVLEEARAAEQHSVALAAIARLEKQAELVGRLAGELVDRQRIETVSVVFAAEWQRLRPPITAALLPYPAASAALVEALADAGA